MDSYKNVITIFCIIGIFGCNRHPIPQSITNSQLIGVWEVKKDSLKRLNENGYTEYLEKKDHRIEFFDNGTCLISTYQSLVCDPILEEQENNYIKLGNAKWQITSKSGFTGVLGQIDQIPAVVIKEEIIDVVGNVKVKEVRGLYYYISVKDNNIILWNYIGDPDYNDYMEFIKIN